MKDGKQVLQRNGRLRSDQENSLNVFVISVVLRISPVVRVHWGQILFCIGLMSSYKMACWEIDFAEDPAMKWSYSGLLE